MTKQELEAQAVPRKEPTVRLELDLYERLREAAFRRRISHQQVLMEAIKLWLR